MFQRSLQWVRRHTPRALALAVAPGLALLAVDAWVAHYVGTLHTQPLQVTPVVFGLSAFVVMSVAVFPPSRRVFTVASRLVGGLGVLIGVGGSVLHARVLLEELQGRYTLASLEGALSVSPPLFAPLAFAGVGALLCFLASPSLLMRFQSPQRPGAEVRPLALEDAGSTGASNGSADERDRAV